MPDVLAGSERDARATRRDYCRGCTGRTLHPFAGWATEDGRENSIRPRAYYRSCGGCGLVVMVLGDVTDAEGLARAILDSYLRPLGGAATATTSPVGPPPTDWEAALQFLSETAWLLYSEKWNPSYGDHGNTFTGFASSTLRVRLPRWIREENGDASERAKGRVHPKAHAPSVSVSLDKINDEFGEEQYGDRSRFERVYSSVGRREVYRDPVEAAFAGRVGDFADDRSPDLAWALSAASRANARTE